jgi:mannose-6-phosphate isomerase-like protein (cupin superfamily)
VLSGDGSIEWNGKEQELYSNMAMLIPADCEFTISADDDADLTMYLVSEPIPDGFRPNEDIIFVDENEQPISSTTGHWCHIVKPLFQTDDGLGTLENILTVSFDPMTIGHPHSHVEGTEEVWAQIDGTSLAFIGKEIRWQEPGTAYFIPPNGNTPHSNINTTDTRQRMFYFARYRDHEVRQ